MTSGAYCVFVTLFVAAVAADSTDFFLREIFHKYGNSGVITYEGFEHLLENLGLGRLEFDTSHSVALHRVNGTFQEVHDELRLHTHHHSRRRRGLPDTDSPLELDLGIPPSGDDKDDGEASEVSPHQETPAVQAGLCLSAQELLRSHGLPTQHDVLISQPVFLHLCPAIVYEIDQRACYSTAAAAAASASATASAVSHVHHVAAGATGASWLYATLSIAIISVSGVLGLIVVPLASKAYYHQVLSFLIATAVGTLCGDALLHMLPHAIGGGDDHVANAFHSLAVFGAMLFFYCMETVLQIQRANSKKEIPIKDLDVQEKIINSGETGSNMDVGIIIQDPDRRSSFSRKHTHSHGISTGIAGSHDHGVSSVAWIVIVGDGLHNLTDGLAIGAGFAGSTAAGLATAIAVFFHELPHELGDFAVLLQSGMSIRRALVYNILSSVLSFIGMACGLWVGEYEDAAMWIYAATAGSFLYIALVDLLPEMSSSCDDPPTIRDLIIHTLGIATGGAIMLIIALYEEKLGTLFN